MSAEQAEQAEVTDLAERLRQRDEREQMLGARLRQAFTCLEPIIKDPAAETYLLAPQSVDAWRVLRDEDPDIFLVYLSTVRARFGNVVARLVSDRVGLPGIGGAASREPLAGYTLAAIWENYEPPRYLVKRLLGPGAVTVLFGQSGHLKSVTAIDLALCVATGTAFHGVKTRRAGVLYVAGEGHAGIKKRIRAWLLGRGMDSTSEQPAVYVTSAGADLIGNPEQLHATVAHAAEVLGMAIELVIIDTLAACFGPGDENHAADMGRAIAGARTAGAEAAVLLVHHTGHGQIERERGSYALIAAADYRLQATYDEVSKLLELKWHKCKDDEKPEPMTFECKTVELEWQDEDGEELTSVVLERLEGASLPQAARTSGIGKNEQTALKSLRALYSRNRKSLEQQDRDPAEARILIDGWRHDCERRGLIYKRWHDVKTSLAKDRLIVIDEPFVYISQAAA